MDLTFLKRVNSKKLKLMARRLSKENKEKEGYLLAWIKPEELELIVSIEMNGRDPKKIMRLVERMGKSEGRKGRGSIKETVLKIAKVEGVESAERYLLSLLKQKEISTSYFQKLRRLLRENYH